MADDSALQKLDAVKKRCTTETRDGCCMYEAEHPGNCVISPNKDFMARSIERRKREWQDEWRQLQRDVEHWNRTHPDEEPIVIEPITEAEIGDAKNA